MPWRDDKPALAAWQHGQTGVPIVDAGMRQLWQTGWMHNRVRMIVASFLVKHLLIPWQDGEAWFWDTLVDADLANNAANWQWVAGLRRRRGAVFPDLQSGAAGPEIRRRGRLCPPLRAGTRPDWTRDTSMRRGRRRLMAWRKAGVTLGRTYPHPIVDLAEGRARALGRLRPDPLAGVISGRDQLPGWFDGPTYLHDNSMTAPAIPSWREGSRCWRRPWRRHRLRLCDRHRPLHRAAWRSRGPWSRQRRHAAHDVRSGRKRTRAVHSGQP